MMRTITIFILLGLSTHLKLFGYPDLAKDPVDSLRARADQYLEALTGLRQFNGVVLLKKGETLVLTKAYNLSEESLSSLRVNLQSQFDLRSVAKLFAKRSLLKLQSEGKINLNAYLGSYIADFPRGNELQLQHLLDHTSGLPRELNTGDKDPINMNPEEVMESAMLENLEFEPGSRSQYSNVGYQILYYLIGLQNQSSFEAFLRKTYFEPLDMGRSGGNFETESGLKTDYAHGHYLDQEGKMKCVCSFPKDEMRMGNLYSTVSDLEKFLSSLDREKDAELLDAGKIMHAGGTKGKRAYVERDFEHDYTLIFLSNVDFIPFERIVKDLQGILKGKQVELPKAVQRKETEVPVSVLKNYTGTYDLVDAGHLRLSIKLENEALHLYQKGAHKGELKPETDTVFFGDPSSEESIEFVKDSIGNFNMLVDFQGVRWKAIRISD